MLITITLSAVLCVPKEKPASLDLNTFPPRACRVYHHGRRVMATFTAADPYTWTFPAKVVTVTGPIDREEGEFGVLLKGNRLDVRVISLGDGPLLEAVRSRGPRPK